MASRFDNPVTFSDTVNFGKVPVLPDGSINRSALVASGANLDEAGLEHRHTLIQAWPSGADVSAGTQLLHTAYRAGTVLNVSVAIDVAPSTSGSPATVDVMKSSAGSSFSTILSAPVAISSTCTARSVLTGTLSGTPTLAQGDILEVVVTSSGTTGTRCQGMQVAVVVSENGA